MKYKNIKYLETTYNKLPLLVLQLIQINDNGSVSETASLTSVIDHIKNQTRNNYNSLMAAVNLFSDREDKEAYHLYIKDIIIKDIRSLGFFHVSDSFNVERFINS